MKPEWIDLDVRPVLAGGREPFALIMNHLQTLEPGQALRITAPFFPKPLVEMLEAQGWSIESRNLEGDDWEVRIQRPAGPEEVAAVELDLRELAPPEPMVRILEALETLPRGGRLVARTPFYPENLLPILEQRGFRCEVERESGQSCRLDITHV